MPIIFGYIHSFGKQGQNNTFYFINPNGRFDGLYSYIPVKNPNLKDYNCKLNIPHYIHRFMIVR